VKAWRKQGKQLALADVPAPAPAPDELLLRVQSVSLNRGEVRGAALAPEGRVPGWDVAGIVESPAVDGSGPAKGARIAALLDSGGWAELAVVPAGRAAVVPDGVDLDVAATLPIAGLTVLRALALAEAIGGQRVLITGGSGGVGQFAIQLAAQAGAEVTAVSSRMDRHDELKRLGAGDVVASIEDAEGPFRLVLESVGGGSLAKAIELVGREGGRRHDRKFVGAGHDVQCAHALWQGCGPYLWPHRLRRGAERPCRRARSRKPHAARARRQAAGADFPAPELDRAAHDPARARAARISG